VHYEVSTLHDRSIVCISTQFSENMGITSLCVEVAKNSIIKFMFPPSEFSVTGKLSII